MSNSSVASVFMLHEFTARGAGPPAGSQPEMRRNRIICACRSVSGAYSWPSKAECWTHEIKGSRRFPGSVNTKTQAAAPGASLEERAAVGKESGDMDPEIEPSTAIPYGDADPPAALGGPPGTYSRKMSNESSVKLCPK